MFLNGLPKNKPIKWVVGKKWPVRVTKKRGESAFGFARMFQSGNKIWIGAVTISVDKSHINPQCKFHKTNVLENHTLSNHFMLITLAAKECVLKLYAAHQKNLPSPFDFPSHTSVVTCTGRSVTVSGAEMRENFPRVWRSGLSNCTV